MTVRSARPTSCRSGAVGTVPLFLVMNRKVPANNLKEFIAYAKANPDKVSYAAAGAGTDARPHRRRVRAPRRARQARLRAVPRHRAGGDGGDAGRGADHLRVDGTALEFVESGTLRVLAAATPRAHALCAGRADLRGGGLPRLRNVDLVLAVRAASGTPKEIVEQLNGYTRDVQDDPESKKRLDALFVDPLILTQPEFAALVKADAVKWERIVREAGIKLE